MPIITKVNSKGNIRKLSSADLPLQPLQPVLARYEADSTASQTIINMSFSVDQANKDSFQLFIDGKLLREGASNDFTFTSIQTDNTSSQITLTAAIAEGLNIIALKLGLKQDSSLYQTQTVASSGLKNYFSLSSANPDFSTNSTSPWSACSLTFSAGSPTGAPTLIASPLPTQMSISATSTLPLEGSYSLLLSKPANNTQYQGFISGILTIDREDTAKVLYGSFSYEVASNPTNVSFSGASDQSLEIWIYNTASGQWTQPAGYRGMNQTNGVGKVVFSFQTDGTATNNSYKIAIITQQTSALSYSVKFDDFVLGPQAIVLGTPVTDWQTYTLNVTATTTNPTFGTVSSNVAKWRRVGDSIQIIWVFRQTSAGTAGSGAYLFSLPPGLSIDTTKATGSGSSVPGTFGPAFFGAGTAGYVGISTSVSTTSFILIVAGNTFTSSTPTDNFGGANAAIGFQATIPIAGWSSNVQSSSDTDTRVVACKVGNTSVQSVSSGSWVKCTSLGSVSFDTHGSYDSTNKRIYFPVSGFYSVFVSATFAANGTGGRAVGYTIDGGSIPTEGGAGQGGVAADTLASTYQSIVKVNAGQYIELAVYQSSGVALNLTNGLLQIQRISGPSVINATETVACEYISTAGNTINASTDTFIDFATKQGDTHNSVLGANSGNNVTATNTWRFVAPVSGRFLISASVSFNMTVSAGYDAYIRICRDGVDVQDGTRIGGTMASSTPLTLTAIGEVQLNAGQYISIKVYQNSGSGRNMNTASGSNRISIVRVGN